MSATVQAESPQIVSVRISGRLTLAELHAAQQGLSKLLDTGNSVSLLVTAEQFEGFETAQNWNDLSFQQRHDHQIQRMAIVASQEWEDLSLLFTGAGLRKVEIQFFPPWLIKEARAWLNQDKGAMQ